MNGIRSSSASGSSSSSANTSASSKSGTLTDIVDIRSSRGGTLTAAAGDLFSLGDLFKATAPTGSSIAGYKVALRSDQAAPNDGQLLIGDRDVTGQLDFTADEFRRLHFKAGPSGSQQDLVVVAQLGTRLANGTLSDITDSPAVQISASVTGIRSINAIGALLTQATGADADFVNTAQEASIFTGYGQARPSLSTVGLSYDPQIGENLLASLVGRFQSTQVPTTTLIAPLAANVVTATALLLNPRYAGAIATSQMTGFAPAGNNQGAVPWLFNPLDLEGYQTGGIGLTLQTFTVAAYQASMKAQ